MFLIFSFPNPQQYFQQHDVGNTGQTKIEGFTKKHGTVWKLVVLDLIKETWIEANYTLRIGKEKLLVIKI